MKEIEKRITFVSVERYIIQQKIGIMVLKPLIIYLYIV
jgi:hypothetical protein